MTPEELTAYALGKPGAWLDTPWENDRVAKVGEGASGKIFAFLGDDAIGVKCGAGRDEADEWLVRYPHDASVMSLHRPLGLEHPAHRRGDPRRRDP